MFTATGDAVLDGQGRPMEKEDMLRELGHDKDICAVNVRMLDGVDLGKLHVFRKQNRGRPPIFVVD